MSRRALASLTDSGAPLASTRDQAIKAARRLLQSRSYLGFSLQDVADAIAVRKPSLYHHFPSKEALGTEVLREVAEAFHRWAQSVAERTPAERLDAYFDMYRNDIRAGERVCPGGSFVPGWDCIEEGLRRAVRELRADQVLWLSGVLGALLPDGKPAPALASYVYASCQGALVTARMTGSVREFDQVIDQVRRTLLS